MKITIDGESKHKDSGQIIKQHPDTEVIIANQTRDKLGYYFTETSHARQVFQNPQNYKKQSVGYFNETLVPHGIGNLEGQQWKMVRKLLSPYFNYEEMIKRFQMINNLVQNQINELKKSKNFDEPLNLEKQVQKVTGNIVVQSFFKLQQKDQQNIIDMVEDTSCRSVQILLYCIPLALKMTFLGGKNAVKYLRTQQEQKLVKDIQYMKEQIGIQIQERIDLRKSPDYSPKEEDFLDAQLNDKNFTKDLIVDQFVSLYIAGTETSLNAFMSTLYFLSKNKEIQQKAREEINKLFLNNNLQNQNDFKPEHLRQLNYLQAIINETLRLKPPAGFLLEREAIRDHYIGDYKINKGDQINIINFSLGNTEKYFPNPEKFDPERWTNNKDVKLHQVYHPFASGQRNCIGQHLAQMELKVLLVRYIANFEINYEEGEQEPMFQQKMTYQLSNTNFLRLRPII